MTDTIHHRLQRYCARAFPQREGLRVTHVAALEAGWESDLYAFNLEYQKDTGLVRQELILRLHQGGHAGAKAAGEFRTMRRLNEAGYPVPRVHLVEEDAAPLGKPFLIMERIEGQSMYADFLQAPEPERRRLLTLFCTLFLRLHRLDWRHFAGRDDALDHDPYIFIDRWLQHNRETIVRYELPDFFPLLSWADSRREALACPRPSPVHRDFHPDNVLLRPDGSPAVIDWTGFGISDYRFDLAWTLALADAHVGPAYRTAVLQEYQRLAGAEVEHLAPFEAFACVRRLLDATISLTRGAEARGMRPEAVTVMKQEKEAYARVYEMLHERTGLHIPEVEALLASLG
ncbi:MAG: phosphotransferase [Chloroflexota bacterium]|nr:phosphotransferase [Chloroflexota bacterium]